MTTTHKFKEGDKVVTRGTVAPDWEKTIWEVVAVEESPFRETILTLKHPKLMGGTRCFESQVELYV